MLVEASREVWLFDIFADQNAYTSEIAIFLLFTNPVSNFFDNLSDDDKSFHITTYDFDTTQFPDLVSTDYSDAAMQAFITTVKTDINLYAKGIDQIYGTWLRPELKCATPCYQCLDSDPKYCTACWGPGKNGDFKQIFLQTSLGLSTCKEECDDKYSVNGNDIEMKNPAGEFDPTKTYNECQDCDLTCGTCEAQKVTGEKGDKNKCTSCGFSFPFFVPSQQICMTNCGAGYFDKVVGVYPSPSECGICEKPCSTCRPCVPGQDKNCEGDPFVASARFCTACNQDDFFPEMYDDIDGIDLYF